MGDIFREIDEELRQERFEKLWQRYGKLVIGAAVAVVVAIVAVSGWRQYQESRQLEDGARFAAAKTLLAENKDDDARALFEALARESGTSYGVLSRFHAAALKAKGSDAVGAAGDYDALADDSDVARSLRDLAVLQWALSTMSADSFDAATVTRRLQPLAAANNPWRHSALELLGLAAQHSGNPAKAREFFRRIVDDAAAPRNLRGRATQMLTVIGEK